MASEVSNLLSRCGSCGYVFPTRVIEIASSQGVSFEGVTEPCPKCGMRAQVLDGTYNFDVQGIAELVSGPQFTKDVYDKFIKLIERVKDSNIEHKKFIEEVESISPELAFSIKKYIPNDSSSLIALLTFLLALFAQINGDNSEKHITNTNIINNTVNNYNQYTYKQNSPVDTIVGYKRQFNLAPIRPKDISNEELLREDTEAKHKSIKKKVKKKKKYINVKEQNISNKVMIDTSSCDSTKETIKRLLKKR